MSFYGHLSINVPRAFVYFPRVYRRYADSHTSRVQKAVGGDSGILRTYSDVLFKCSSQTIKHEVVARCHRPYRLCLGQFCISQYPHMLVLMTVSQAAPALEKRASAGDVATVGYAASAGFVQLFGFPLKMAKIWYIGPLGALVAPRPESALLLLLPPPYPVTPKRLSSLMVCTPDVWLLNRIKNIINLRDYHR